MSSTGQVSTSSEVVRSLGGRLRIAAELPDRPPVYLAGFGDIAQPTGKGHPCGGARPRLR